MQSEEKLTDFLRRAAQIRLIAEGIFDKKERDLLLKFVDDCEKLAVVGGAS